MQVLEAVAAAAGAGTTTIVRHEGTRATGM